MNIKFKLIIVVFNIFLSLFCCSKGYSNEIQKLLNSKNFRKFSFNKSYTPSAYQLSAIHFILKNTFENNIHKMRGETENLVFINKKRNKHGYSEAVFDVNKQPVTNSYNQASFNFYLYETEPIKHFGHDMLPWLEWGNTKDDPTSFNERLFHYTLDLNIGIQSFIFEGSKEKLNKINFEKLPDEEKEIYQFFCYILFNKNYEIQLNEDNRSRLKKDSKFYFKYFEQIQKQLGVNNRKY